MIQSTNPATGQIIQTYDEINTSELDNKLAKAHTEFHNWKNVSITEREKLFGKLCHELRQNRDHYAALITHEMGCPISQAKAEIEKCAYIAELTASQAHEYLTPKNIKTDAKESYISYEPLGTVLHVAPWNYPFYLALRPALAAIMAGNTVVLKHASNVPQCSLALDELFKKAGFPDGVFESLLISSSQVRGVIEDERIAMVTIIGSDRAGAAVGCIAGQEIKKTVMELGGSDPMIVMPGVDIDEVVKAASYSRLRNAGQSCNAAKRFIVHREVVVEFTSKLREAFGQETIGDPMEEATTFGPVATQGSLDDLERQIGESVQQGAKIITGGKRMERAGYYFEPTILADVHEDMPVMQEEVFGPVAPIFSCNSLEEAIRVANNTPYGLGASLWTKDLQIAKKVIPQLQAGNVYINKVVRGNPKLPFGGIKKTGFGREFSEHGFYEFVNIKSVVIA